MPGLSSYRRAVAGMHGVWEGGGQLWLVAFAFCLASSLAACPPPEDDCRCRMDKARQAIYCCNLPVYFLLNEGLACAKWNNAREVHIKNATIATFYANQSYWENLETLSVTDGHIRRIQGRFKGKLEVINFSRNNISEIDSDTFQNLPRLSNLDLSSNNIQNIPNITINKQNFTLDISNNSLIWCNSILELLIRYQNVSRLQFRNGNDTTCLSVRSFHWFNSTDAMTLAQVMLLIKGLDEDCPKHCICGTHRAEFNSKDPVSLKFNVNCSNQNLTELPPLPPNTIYLDVSYNMIKSLKPMYTNESYAEIRYFIADNNKIESMSALEGSRFIDNFAVLSLRNNKIRSVPTYILSNAFDRTFQQNRKVKIGGNRLQCDCGTSQIKMWLLNNKNYIEDYNEVLCDKAFDRVIDIDPSKICIHEKSWTDYIHYIIAGELLLLVSLISKVVYDYWVFKSRGYLPWPASQMPKLPCDWCFET